MAALRAAVLSRILLLLARLMLAAALLLTLAALDLIVLVHGYLLSGINPTHEQQVPYGMGSNARGFGHDLLPYRLHGD
jgi:hypothetical protein